MFVEFCIIYNCENISKRNESLYPPGFSWETYFPPFFWSFEAPPAALPPLPLTLAFILLVSFLVWGERGVTKRASQILRT